MKIIKLLCTFVLLLNLACSKQESSAVQNPPQLQNNNKPIDDATDCSQKFINRMTPAEVAAAALTMKENCKMSEQEIINLAEKF